MRMGADRCFGVQGARGTQKQGKQGTYMVLKVRIWVLWPGKFPRTSCFGRVCKKNGANGFRWVQVDANGANGRMFNGGSKKKAKGAPNGRAGDVL